MYMGNLYPRSPIGVLAPDHAISIDEAMALFAPAGNAHRRERFAANYWLVYSPKLKRRITLYRDIGYDHWVLVETDSRVVRFIELPNGIRYRLHGRDYACRFDMVLAFADIVECRHLFNTQGTSVLNAAQQARAQRAHDWCDLVGLRYLPFTDVDVERHRAYIENWKLLLKDARNSVEVLEERVWSYVAAVGELTLEEVHRLMADCDPSEIRAAIAGCLHRGRLHCADLPLRPLASESLIEVRHG